MPPAPMGIFLVLTLSRPFSENPQGRLKMCVDPAHKNPCKTKPGAIIPRSSLKPVRTAHIEVS